VIARTRLEPDPKVRLCVRACDIAEAGLVTPTLLYRGGC
jgi:hypothetical protein